MDNKIRDNLEKQFGKLTDQETAPDRLKEEVFQTLDTVNMVGDIASLFTSTFVRTGAELIDVIQDDNQIEDELDKLAKEDDINIEDPEDQSPSMEEPEN